MKTIIESIVQLIFLAMVLFSFVTIYIDAKDAKETATQAKDIATQADIKADAIIDFINSQLEK